MSKINVLFVTPKLPKKDTEVAYSFIREEINALKKICNVNCSVFTFDYKDVPSILSNFSKLVHAYNTIDIVHGHFVIPYGFIADIIAKILRKPLIITVHGFDILVDRKLAYGVNRFVLARLITRFTLIESRKVIANSFILKAACMKYGIPSSKIIIIPWGVDLQVFRPMSNDELMEKMPASMVKLLDSGKDFVNILCAKRLERIYGIDYLIKACKELVNRGIRNFRLMLVGGGRLFKDYQRLSNQLGLSDNILFLNLVPKNIMSLFYNLCDFTVVSSLIEGFGLVVAESLACGKPVVGTSVGGILDQVIDGFNGFLVPPYDYLSLADKMQILIEDKNLRNRMSKNARLFAELYLDLKKRISKIVKLYEDIMK
ncbi:MAG: glycosyltransferase [Candidatus Bathyarchaeia archaeon]